MRDEEIHSGDVLRFRSWDDIQENGAYAFVSGMKYLCGQIVHIIKDDDILSTVEGVEGNWAITPDMFEPCLDPIKPPTQKIEDLMFS